MSAEHSVGEEKPAKKTDADVERAAREIDLVAQKIKDSSGRTELKGPALQNAAQR